MGCYVMISADGIKASKKELRAITMRSCLGDGSVESQEKDAWKQIEPQVHVDQEVCQTR